MVVALGILLPHEVDHAADSAYNSKHCQDDSSDGSSIHFAFFRLGGRTLNSLETDHRIGPSCKSNSILGDKGGTKSQVANGVLLDSEEAIRSGLDCKISRLKVEGVFELVLRDEGEHHVSVCSGAGGSKHGQASGGVGTKSLASSQLGLGLIAQLTAQSPYPMLSVLNQGVHIRIHQPLPQGEALTLRGRLVDASDDGFRARVHSHVEIGTASQPQALEIDSYAAVVLRKRPAGADNERDEPDFETLGHWQAGADEGVKFFLLTGDFNPIHTLPMLARHTRFRGCIMHGYGAFAQVFEAIQNAGHIITDIDVRFIKPLPLPSPPLLIQVAATADTDGRHALRLTDIAGNLYQVGSFLPQAR